MDVFWWLLAYGGNVFLAIWFGALLAMFYLGWQSNNLMWWFRDRRAAKKNLRQYGEDHGA